MYRCVCLLPVIALVLACGGLVMAAGDMESYREAIEKIVADELTPDIEVADRLRGVEFQEGEWPEAGVMRVVILADYRTGRSHSVAVDEAAGQVVGYLAPDPAGPVPMEVMPAEQAVEIAEQFCSRHLPELFAEGGDVAVTVEEAIGQNGARVVHLQRTVNGVNVPTLADIGVRVYDGKVVYMRRRHEPLDGKLQLPGEIALEQAQAVAGQNVPWDNFEPLLFFDCVHEVIGTEAGQCNVWTVWAELKTKNADNRFLERFNCWRIDANGGEVVSSEWSKPTRELYFRYQAAGGKHFPLEGRPGLPPMLEDARPVWSPDGSQIAFLSDRPRPGYPAWMKRPNGLFVINADGTELKCLAGLAFKPQWSPDGTRIAYTTRPAGALYVASLSDGAVLELTPPENADYEEAVWLDNSQLLVDAPDHDMNGSLVVVDLEHPELGPQETGIRYGADDAYFLLASLPGGEGVICGKYGGGRGREPWDLLRVKMEGQQAKAEVVCEQPDEGRAGDLAGTDRVLLWDDRPSTRGGEMWMVNLQTGRSEAWKPPDPWLPEELAGKTRARPDDVCFSPDGSRIAFVTGAADPQRQRGSAYLIWTCQPDGSDLQQVTPWESSLVPMVGQ